MERLNLPDFELKLAEQGGKKTVWDPIRKIWTAFTPEEYVRQGFVAFLSNHKGYPISHIANEQSITLNGMNRRCDSVVYGRQGKPVMIVEYKASTVAISQKVFNQIARYNLVLKVDYLTVSNGISHYCVKMDYDKGTYTFLNDIPEYQKL
ncbi:MAG: type I restriction enzyme HsdR N-terminal domain-containing protein [Bacteroidaceae bacterium]|nr:type I restriction enzyme HsdR N-terminal domain-containing protein [Bacteroidaceae bacterium]